MSTQAEDVIEEGVEGVDDAVIDSLIDAVHFDDLVLEKDVADMLTLLINWRILYLLFEACC